MSGLGLAMKVHAKLDWRGCGRIAINYMEDFKTVGDLTNKMKHKLKGQSQRYRRLGGRFDGCVTFADTNRRQRKGINNSGGKTGDT